MLRRPSELASIKEEVKKNTSPPTGFFLADAAPLPHEATAVGVQRLCHPELWQACLHLVQEAEERQTRKATGCEGMLTLAISFDSSWSGVSNLIGAGFVVFLLVRLED